MSQSLNDLKKAKRRRDKRAQQQAQAIRDTKQDEDRERFRKQAEAETAEAYSNSTLPLQTKRSTLKRNERPQNKGEKISQHGKRKVQR